MSLSLASLWNDLVDWLRCAWRISRRSRQPEVRRWVRFPSRVALTYRPAALAPDVRRSGQARDVCPGGLGLLVNARLRKGELLSVDLPGKSRGEPLSLLSSVRHCRPGVGGLWAVGCSFIRDLSEEELRGFL
jgi:hypothetical protein